jgi:hypothetical protein
MLSEFRGGIDNEPSGSNCAGNTFHDDEATDGEQASEDCSKLDEEALHILPLKYLRLLIPYPPSVRRVSDAMST